MDSWRPQNVVELSEDSDDSSCPSLTDPDAEEDASLSALPLPPGRAIGLVAAASSASGTAAAANGIESHDDDSLPGLDDDEVPALDSDSEGSYEMSDDDEPPPMLDAASDEDSEADDDDESEPPGLDSADEQDTADEPEDEDPPELVTGTDDDEGGSDDDGDDDSEPPSLEDNDSDDEGADYGGLKPGFLGGANKPKRKAKPAESRYSGEGVGRKEAGPSAAARSGSKPSKPSGGVAASVAADFANSTGSYFSTPTPGSFKQHPPPKPQSQQPKQPKAPSSQQQKQWQQSSKRPRAQPAAAAPAAPQQPAEVVVAREGLEAINKEREEARRRLQMQTASSSAALTQPVGRCCLNRGLDGDIRFCEKDKMRALVMPDERRVQMKCSAGCLMAWHQECWRTFQQLHEHETRDPNTGHGINLIQALKVKDKAKDKPLVKCVTDGCNGYINLLGVFEGPLGHETFKNHLFTPTPLVLAAIKEAEAAQKAALVEARAAAKAEKDAASFARWYEKYGPKEPKQPKKPRVKKPKPQQPADGAVGAGAAAASTGAGIVDDDLMSFLSSGKKIEMIASNAAAAAPAAVSQQQPSRPKGIQVKNRVDPKLRVLHVKQQQQQQQEEEEAPRTPSTTALSESTSQAASASLEPTCSRHTSVLDHQSNAEQQLEATSARDHVDPSYHADLTEYMAVHGGAGPQEAKAKGRKEKKKGMRMHLEEFQQVAGGPSAQAAPSAAPAAPQPPPAAAAAAQPAPPARKQRAPRMGEFPALHEALLGKAEPASAEPDFLAEALMQLKIGADDGRHTAYLLFECVDFFMLRKKEMDAEEAMRDVIQSKSGIPPIMTWVFPQQEAVAVLMPTIDAAVLAFINCRLIPTWGRKQLRVCFLSDAPDDETLHRVYPDYLPPQMAEQKRMEEELRVLQQQAGVDSVEVDSAEREALAALVRDGAITDVQLLEALEKGMTAAQAAAMAAAARKGKEASNAASAPNAGSSSNTSSSTSVKDKKEALVGKAADTSKAAAAAAEATQPAGIPPPRPPPEPPALKSAADAAAKQQQAKAVTAAFKQRQQLQQQQLQQQQVRSSSAMPQTSTAGHVVMQQPAAVYGSMPMMPAMMQPAMIMQPAVPAMYMPVSSGMMPATMTPAVPVQMVPVQQYSWQQQQQHLQQQQWLLQQQQQQQRQQQQRPSYVMQQQPLPPPQQSQQQQQQQYNTAGARHHDDDGEDEDNWGQLDQEPKQEQERGRSMAAGSNRAISATTASTSSLRNASLSPGSKMNPLAPEFKPAGASQPGPSRLNASTSSAAVAEDVADEAQQAEAATHAAAAAGAISTDSDAASSSKQPADAAPAGAAPSASAAADGGEASGGKADGQSSSSGGGVSGGGDSAGSSSSTAGTSTPSTAANASKDDQPVDSAAAAIAAAAAAAAASPSGEDRSPAAPDASAAGIDTSESVQPASGSDAGSQQAAAAAPTPAAAAAAAPAAPHGLPPDHVFDAVYLTGCQTEHLSVYRNPTANIKLPVNHFGGEADVAGVSEAAGLIVYNNDAHETEGLWRALHQEGGNIEWQPVAQYWGVPLTVMHQPLLGSGGIKRAYRGAEGLAITKAMWDWSHPQQQQQQTGAQAGASGQQPAPAPGSGPSSTAAAGASSQQPQPTAAAAGGGASTGTQHPARPGPSASSTVAGSSAAGSRPGTAGSTASGHAAAAAAGTDGAGPGPGAAGRALPGVFGLLARRPPSSGGTGAAGSQAAAAAATSSSAAAPAAPAAAAPPPAGPAAAAAPAPAAAPPAVGASSGGGVSGYLRCTLCQQKQPAWVVIQPCKHLGPCKDCLAPVGGERKKTYPPEYPTCLQCNATVVELMRIII